MHRVTKLFKWRWSGPLRYGNIVGSPSCSTRHFLRGGEAVWINPIVALILHSISVWACYISIKVESEPLLRTSPNVNSRDLRWATIKTNPFPSICEAKAIEQGWRIFFEKPKTNADYATILPKSIICQNCSALGRWRYDYVTEGQRQCMSKVIICAPSFMAVPRFFGALKKYPSPRASSNH